MPDSNEPTTRSPRRYKQSQYANLQQPPYPYRYSSPETNIHTKHSAVVLLLWRGICVSIRLAEYTYIPQTSIVAEFGYYLESCEVSTHRNRASINAFLCILCVCGNVAYNLYRRHNTLTYKRKGTTKLGITQVLFVICIKGRHNEHKMNVSIVSM